MNVMTANIAAAVVVVIAGVAGGSSAARGCEYSQDARVVGFNADGSQAFLLIQFATITINILDLGTGKIVETFRSSTTRSTGTAETQSCAANGARPSRRCS